MNANEKMVSARIQLLLNQPFFGNIATRMPVMCSASHGHTMATDMENIYFHEDFVDKLNIQESVFCLCHEILHCVFEHGLRLGSRIHKLWNVATDYAVNGILVKNKIGSPPSAIEIYYSPSFDGKSAEEIYDILLQQCGNDGDMSSLPVGELLDDHSFQTALTQEKRAELEQKIRDNITSAMYSIDDVPSCVRGIINSWNEPKYDLSVWIEETVVSTVKYDTSFRYFDRKKSGDVIVPGASRLNEIEVAFAIDTSGSIDDATLNESLSAIKHVMDKYGVFKVTVFSFDTRVHNPVLFDSSNADDLDSYTAEGGGGTCFDCIWNYLKDNEIEPKILIILTDGVANGWGDSDYCQTAWVIKGTNRIPSHGEYMHYV